MMKSFWCGAFAFAVAASSLVACASAPGDDATSTSEGAIRGVGDACGGFTAKKCKAGLFCKYEEAQHCGAGDQSGVCTRPPRKCNEQTLVAICGCDGKTYSSECEANRAGTSISHSLGCESVCDPTAFDKVVAPSLDDVKGTWSRTTQSGNFATIETLVLRDDFTYGLEETYGPHCIDPTVPCSRIATQRRHTEGTFRLEPGHGVQLQPTASDANLAENFGLEKNCDQSTRLHTVEQGKDVYLTRTSTNAHACQADSECVRANVGPNPTTCDSGTVDGAACDAGSHTCVAACVPACKPGETQCMQCGILPPDGVCRAFKCLPPGQRCIPVP